MPYHEYIEGGINYGYKKCKRARPCRTGSRKTGLSQAKADQSRPVADVFADSKQMDIE